MSQPEATLYIQPPMLETTVAIQMTANILWRKGAHADADAPCGEAEGGAFAFGAVIPVNRIEDQAYANPDWTNFHAATIFPAL
jgi:hypothetical protein